MGPGQGKEDLITSLRLKIAVIEVAVASNPPRQVHVLLHHGHALDMDGAKVGVLEKTYDVSLCGFLEGIEGLRLEPEHVVHITSDASD